MDKIGQRTEPFRKSVRISWVVLTTEELRQLRSTVQEIVRPGGTGLIEAGCTIDGRRVWDTDLDRLLAQAGTPADFALSARGSDAEGRPFTVDLNLQPGAASCVITGHDGARVEGAAVLLTRFFAGRRERAITAARWVLGAGSLTALGLVGPAAWLTSRWMAGALLLCGLLLLVLACLVRPAAHVQIIELEKRRTRAEDNQLLMTILAVAGTLVAIASFLLDMVRSPV